MRLFRKVFALLFILTMVFAISACGAAGEEAVATTDAGSGTDTSSGADTGSGEASEIEIGVAYCTLAEEFAVDLQKGVQDKAAELGYTLYEVDYALDLSKGNDEVSNFINMGVDAIILWPLDADAFAGAGEQAAEAGIPVITVDSTIAENVSCFIASDNVAGGLEAATYGLEAINGEGTVLVITPAPGMTSLEDRCQGYYDALENYPNIELIEQMDAGTNARAGYAQTVENALNANPDINLILANCGDCALGALSAVELYPDKFADVKIIGYDATPEQVSAMQEGRQIIASYAQYPYDIGSIAVESIQKILNNESVEAIIRTPGVLVTYDNVDEFAAS